MNSEGEIKLFAPFPSWENGIESEYCSGWKSSLRSFSPTFNILVLLNDPDKREMALYCHLCGLPASCVLKGQQSGLLLCKLLWRKSTEMRDCFWWRDEWETENPFVVPLLASWNWRACFGMRRASWWLLLPPSLEFKILNLKTWVWNPPGGKPLIAGECKCKIGWKYQWGSSAVELSGTLKMRVL